MRQSDWDAIEIVADRLDKNVDSYRHFRRMGVDELKVSFREASYECARILMDLDEEIGNEAVDYLRENGL